MSVFHGEGGVSRGVGFVCNRPIRRGRDKIPVGMRLALCFCLFSLISFLARRTAVCRTHIYKTQPLRPTVGAALPARVAGGAAELTALHLIRAKPRAIATATSDRSLSEALDSSFCAEQERN